MVKSGERDARDTYSASSDSMLAPIFANIAIRHSAPDFFDLLEVSNTNKVS